LLFVYDGKFQKNLLNNALIAVLIVYGEINVVASASGINWIESDFGIWNSYAAAVSAIASPFVDIRRNYWIAAAWFAEDRVARERRPAHDAFARQESDDSWSTVGRGNFILDNLIADGKAVPMIIVKRLPIPLLRRHCPANSPHSLTSLFAT
jgi:hypothetical protein